MFEAEIQKYVKEGHKALPCKAAKNAFDRYIETVIHDITENDPNCTFEAVLEQIGEKPKTAAEDFLESQPADVIAVWKHQEKTKKRLKKLSKSNLFWRILFFLDAAWSLPLLLH